MAKFKGFTLAELLISLAILGVIATFTIPKVLTAQGSAEETAKFKEAMATISGAYDALRLDSGVSSTTTPQDLTPYFNYVRVDTSSNFRVHTNPFSGSGRCGNIECFIMHNGGIIGVDNSYTPLGSSNFSGTSTTHAIGFYYNPEQSSTSTKGSAIILFYNGRITTLGNLSAGQVNGYRAETDPSYVDF